LPIKCINNSHDEISSSRFVRMTPFVFLDPWRVFDKFRANK
jgi:hypothetical protein